MSTTATLLMLSLGFLVLGVPVSVSFGLGSIAAILLTTNIPPEIIGIQFFSSLNSFLLIAIPLFTLTGFLMESSKTAETIFDFANSVVGFLKGGLGHVNVIASVIFGGISGSGTADVMGIGKIEIAQMTERGYPLKYSAALTAATSILAPVIPPSIIMVVYASVANVSVASALFAGLGPGLLIAGLMMLVNHYYANKYGWGSSTKFDLRNIASKGKNALPALLAPVVLLGGMLSGFFTPTEAAVVAILYIAFISRFVYRELSLSTLIRTIVEVSRVTGHILLILVSASLMAFVLTIENIPVTLSNFMISVTDNKIVLLLLINLALFITGMFINATSAIIILVPLLQPILQDIGVDMVHFGAVMIVNLALGLLTPPFSPDLYAAAAVAKVPALSLVRPLIPFYIVLIIGILLVTFIPEISLFLPRLMFD